MKKQMLPQDKEWNGFWKSEKKKDFNNISFSKQRIINILSGYINDRKNVLDAGCGCGFFSKYFCDQGLYVTSLDYSDEALSITARITERRSIIVKEDLISDNFFSKINNKFDIIFSDGLLEHFLQNDQDKIIRNLVSVLSDGGVLITFVPNFWSPWQIIRPFFMPGIKEYPFVLSSLINLNIRNDLKIIRFGGINTIPTILSPDFLFGKLFGMLLFTVSEKK